jgi:HD-like signal output (HDOD) protein
VSTAQSKTAAPKRIGDLLVQDCIISSKMLVEALEAQKRDGGKIVEVLIKLGYITINEFINFLGHQPGIASIDIAHYQIPREIIALVPKEIVIAYEIFPIDKMVSLLTLAMVCPLDSNTIAKIESVTGLRVKPILCSPDDIRGAIIRYYPDDAFEAKAEKPEKAETVSDEVTTPKIESGLKLGNVVRLIRELKSLPALPDTVASVKQAMEDKNSSPNDVAEKIILDPSVAVKVLSVANSAAYGFPSQVETVELAVALLGLRETYSIVLSAAVMNLFDTRERFNYKSYWEEALNVASASRLIAKASGRGADKSIFTAGLLHDIGRIALLKTAPDQYSRVDPNLSGDDLIKAEQEVLGLAHPEAGFELASNWSLPNEVSDVIRFHHNPDFSEALPMNVNIVSLAENWTCHLALGDVNKNDLLRETGDMISKLKMNPSVASGVFDHVAELQPVHFKWDGS